MCILPPHSRIIPMILGCGIADLTLRHCRYSSLSFLLFLVSVYIWISKAYASRSVVPCFESISADAAAVSFNLRRS